MSSVIPAGEGGGDDKTMLAERRIDQRDAAVDERHTRARPRSER